MGAQKAGTTWLSDYVAEHPSCYMPPLKECHFFDVRSGADMQARRVATNSMKRMLEWLESADGEGYTKALTNLQRAAERAELYVPGDRGLKAYIKLMTERAEGATHLCDFTPSYSACDREVFEEMNSLSNNSKFIFIMRDPVERLWSQARMAGKRFTNRNKAAQFENASKRSLRHYIGRYAPADLPRSNYKRTIEELEAALPNRQILYLFYENLFTDASVKKFCDFVGIEYRPADFGAQSNVGRKMDIPPHIEKELRDGLASQYDFVRDKFGDQVPETWFDAARDPEIVIEPEPAAANPKKGGKQRPVHAKNEGD
ncbi:MAG: sulfotransferase [Pseudomonadota bacterium]